MLTAGDGLTSGGGTVPDQPLDCMGSGPCGIVPYTRKKVFIQDFYAGGNACFDSGIIAEACDGMDHGPAQSFAGRDAVEWDGCNGFTIDEDGNWSASVHLQETSGEGVQLRGYRVDQKWVNGTTGVSEDHFDPINGTETSPDCMSVVTVRYFYYDEFSCSYYRNIDNDCTKLQADVNVASEWICEYARREDSTSKIPTGRYKLMRVYWSGPFGTYKNRSDGHCCDGCPGPSSLVWSRHSYDDFGPVTLPGSGTWQPPQYVIVTRLA